VFFRYGVVCSRTFIPVEESYQVATLACFVGDYG